MAAIRAELGWGPTRRRTLLPLGPPDRGAQGRRRAGVDPVPVGTRSTSRPAELTRGDESRPQLRRMGFWEVTIATKTQSRVRRAAFPCRSAPTHAQPAPGSPLDHIQRRQFPPLSACDVSKLGGLGNNVGTQISTRALARHAPGADKPANRQRQTLSAPTHRPRIPASTGFRKALASANTSSIEAQISASSSRIRS